MNPDHSLGAAARRVTFFLLLVVLAGCADFPLAPLPDTAPEGKDAFALDGKLGVVADGHGFYANMRWRHAGGDDDIVLATPLGQGVARIERNATGVTLTTADGRVLSAPDGETLTEQALGWRLPLNGLPYWARGEPAPGGYQWLPDGSGIEQDGWKVEWERNAGGLPYRITLHRDNLQVRLAVTAWSGGGAP